MFYSLELLSLRRKGRLARCWLAATLSPQAFKRICKPSLIKQTNLCQICEEISQTILIKNNRPCGRFSLYLSSQLMYGAVKILLYQTNSFQNDVIETRKNILFYSKSDRIIQNLDTESAFQLPEVPSISQDFNKAQLDENLYIMQDDPGLSAKIKAMMQDALCLDFGALTNDQLDLLLRGDNISLEMLDSIHAVNNDVQSVLQSDDTSLLDISKMTLFDTSPKIRKSITRFSTNIRISPKLSSEFIKKEEDVRARAEKLAIADELNKKSEQFVSMDALTQKIKPKDGWPLTPQKRLPSDAHVETPTKRRRLSFENAMNLTRLENTTVAKDKTCTDFTEKSSVQLDLESIHTSALQPTKKYKTKKFIDKDIKLSNSTIFAWIKNVKSHTMPSKKVQLNIALALELFKAPSKSMTSLRPKKWNKTLHSLFRQHIIGSFSRETEFSDIVQIRAEHTASREILRLDDTVDKFGEIPSELSADINKYNLLAEHPTVEEKTFIEGIQSLHSIQISEIKDQTDNLLKDLPLPETEDTVTFTHKLEDGSGIVDDSSHLCEPKNIQLTKPELLAMLEVCWRDSDPVSFNDIISPNNYTKADAACCLIFLLESHKEKVVVLKQAAPYDIIWIEKYPHFTSSSNTHT